MRVCSMNSVWGKFNAQGRAIKTAGRVLIAPEKNCSALASSRIAPRSKQTMQSTTSATVIEITCANRGANQVENQPPRRDARDLVDVLLRLNLDDIHAHHAALLHKAMNQLACLQEGHAARRRTCYGGHHRRI